MPPSAVQPMPLEGTLPASWYTNSDIYDLERRAIFSKHWQLLTHKIRVPEVGSFVRYEVAGINFFIIKDRKGEINAFHNVCRHRAYTVIEKLAGKASIIACRYHGWSYGLSGNLAKAPGFGDKTEFDKSQYSLFKIHSRIDKYGFVWANFDTAAIPVSWDEFNESVRVESRLGKYDFDNDYKYDHTWSLEGKYNWKVIADNFNECYHCKTSHPGIAAVTDLENYAVKADSGRIEHFAPGKKELKEGQFSQYGDSSLTFVYPNVGVSVSKPYFYIMRIIPTGPRTVTQEYEVFRNIHITDEEFQDADKFFKEFEYEDKALCENVGCNLASNTYVQGPLHPEKENGVLHFKTLVKSELKKHDALEKGVGKQIWPARRDQELESSVDEDESFCKGICGTGDGGKGHEW